MKLYKTARYTSMNLNITGYTLNSEIVQNSTLYLSEIVQRARYYLVKLYKTACYI